MRILGTSNQAICYNLLNIYFSSLIDLDTLIKNHNITKDRCSIPFYCNDHTITEFEIIDNKNSSTAYAILYELIDTWFLDANRRVGVWSLPWRWHILSIPLTTGRGTGTKTCGLDDVFPPGDLCSRPEALCLYIYIYIYIYIYMPFYMRFFFVYQLRLALWW